MCERLRTDWRYQMGAIIALALIPRMVYLAQIVHWPFFYSPILDSRTQYVWGTALVKTWGLGTPEVLAKPPLYSYYLALNQIAFGAGHPSLFSARFVQLLLSAVTCGLAYLVGRQVFGTAAGLLAGLLAAAYSPGVFNDGELLDTALSTFLATSFLLVVLAALKDPKPGRWLGAGMLLGLLGLTRGNMLLLLFWALALLAGLRLRSASPHPERSRGAVFLRRKLGMREVARLAGVFLLGMVMMIAPITLRNYAITDALVPISGNAGINFYTGNNAQADGYSPIPSGIAWERTWYEAMKAGVFDVSDAYWGRRALQFWRQEPGSALSLLVKRAYLYWNSYEIPNNVSYEWGRAHASVLRWLPLTFGVVGALALLGIALGGWRSREAWALSTFVLTQMVAVVIFFVCDRYRMPAVPVLCVFAGYPLVALRRALSAPAEAGDAGRARARPAMMAVGAALAALAAWWLVNSDLYGVRVARGANRDWFYLGHSYYIGKHYPQARDAFLEAVKESPEDADAYRMLGNVSAEMGDDKAAARYLRQALEIAPDYAESAARLAEIVMSNEWPVGEIAPLVARAAAEQQYNVSVLAALVRVEIREGKLRQAQADLNRAADVLAHVHPGDSRRPIREAAYSRAANDALAAGLMLPPARLLYGPGSAPGMGFDR